jgi:hypothetical protein
MVTLRETTVIEADIAHCFDLARSIDIHLLDNRHWGANAIAIGGVTTGLPELGDTTTYRAKHFAIWQNLTTQITALDRPTYFEDCMTEGIFRFMSHQHHFHALSPTRTDMIDVFTFAAPVPILGRWAEILILRRYMHALLKERIAVIKRMAESMLP